MTFDVTLVRPLGIQCDPCGTFGNTIGSPPTREDSGRVEWDWMTPALRHCHPTAGMEEQGKTWTKVELKK